MNIALWIVTTLLALVFLASGALKLVSSNERLAASGMGWVDAFGTSGVKTIGILEVLGAAGLILPAILDVAPVLVPIAAVGTGLLMLGAIVTHARRREPQGIAVSAVLLVLSLVVIVGRFALVPFGG